MIKKFKNINEVKKFNKEVGLHWFDADTMRFFASKVESELYDNQCFISSEKKCFNDNTRVYKIRHAQLNGSINTVQDFETLEDAELFIQSFTP